MKVEKVNLNKQNAGIKAYDVPGIQRAKLSEAAQDTLTISSKPAFTGLKIKNFLPGQKTIKKLENAEFLKGELGSILITALGTGAIAPFSIAFNPFTRLPKDATEEEKEKLSNKKKYTALRQPVSAVTAVFCQTPIQKVIDRWLDAQINNPEFSKNFSLRIDHSALNTDSSLKMEAEKRLKKNGEKKPFLLLRKQRNEYDAKVKRMAKLTSNIQVNNLAASFLETGKIKVGDRILDNNTIAGLINDNIDSYMKDAEALKINAKGRAFYMKRAKVLIDNEPHLREIFTDAIERFSDNPEGLKPHLENLHKKEPNKDVKTLIKEIIDRGVINGKTENGEVVSADLRIRRMQRTLQRIDAIKESCGNTSFSQAVYHNSMLERNKVLDRIRGKLELIKLDVPKEKGAVLSDGIISETITKVKEACQFDNKYLHSILHDTDTFDSDGVKLAKKIHKDIIKRYKEVIGDNFKASSQAFKIFTGIFTMIITCDVLNWLYPRFMDLCFPKLSGKKVQTQAPEGGNK